MCNLGTFHSNTSCTCRHMFRCERAQHTGQVVLQQDPCYITWENVEGRTPSAIATFDSAVGRSWKFQIAQKFEFVLAAAPRGHCIFCSFLLRLCMRVLDIWIASHFVYLQYPAVHNIIPRWGMQRCWVYTFPALGYSRFMQSGLRIHAPSSSCKVYTVLNSASHLFSSFFFFNFLVMLACCQHSTMLFR